MLSVSRFLGLLAIVLAGLYAVIGLWLYFNQRKLMFHPTHEDVRGLGRHDFQPLKDDRGNFWGYFRAGERDPNRAILFFHGNAGEAIHREWLGQLFPESTVVTLAEYPGYGAREGLPSEVAIFRDALATFDLVKQRWKVPTVVLGESLGTATAVYVAANRDVLRLGLISPFSSIKEIGARNYPYFPVAWLITDAFDSLGYISSVTAPLHIIHGTGDRMVPIELARRLFAKYRGPHKAFTELPHVDHNEVVTALLESSKAQAFRQFLIE